MEEEDEFEEFRGDLLYGVPRVLAPPRSTDWDESQTDLARHSRSGQA
jgi:hypothetical protein